MKLLLSLFLAVVISTSIIYTVNSYANSHIGISSLHAPLPEFLIKNFYKNPKNSDIWIPSKEVLGTSSHLEIQAASAISYDLTTNNVLYEKNSEEKLPMASLTKVMTAIVAVENIDPYEQITISKNAATIGENVMGVTEGEMLTLEDLLYGLFLMSGNDAAEALAEATPFKREGFVFQMNKKAETLGLTNTRFTNPSGLEGDGKQYSTARDLLVMTKYALENNVIAKTSSTYNHFIPYTNSHKAFDLYNETNLLTTYPGVKGFKTGYTTEAGLCLITYLEYKGHKIIAVILNSPSRREEMIEILDHSLQNLGIDPPNRG